MKIKKIASIAIVFSILSLLFGAAPAGASGEELKEFAPRGNSTTHFVPDEIVVKFKHDNQPFRVIKVPAGSVNARVVEYSRRPDVVYAEPNYYAQAIFTPNDPYYGENQWNFGTSDTGGINMEAAWNISTGEGVVVAVIDTGIAYENNGIYKQAPDLAETSFVSGYDFVNNDSHPNDDNSHGTHVAGTIAQSTNNALGVAGIAYSASLMPVKVLNSDGYGSYSDIAEGIRWAADHNANIINLSLGGSRPSLTLKSALAYAYGKGVTIVAAAGNNGASRVSYPAAYDDYVIAVGATRYDTTLSYYSNYGSSLDVVAPGGDITIDQNGDGYDDGILQNTFNPNTKDFSDFGYWFFQGTSMASPHVAGVAALVISHGNATNPTDVRSALQETAFNLGATGWDSTYGWGLVDAYAALKWTGGSDTNTAPTADAGGPYTGTVGIAVSFDGSGSSDPNGDPLTYSWDFGDGGTGTGLSPTHTYAAAGVYDVTLVVSDGVDFSSATTTATISESDVPVTGIMHVDNISITSKISKTAGKNIFYYATAVVSVVDSEGVPVGGVTVSGQWSGLTQDIDIGITDDAGEISMISNNTKNSGTLMFTVTSLAKSGYVYEPSENVETSDSITIP